MDIGICATVTYTCLQRVDLHNCLEAVELQRRCWWIFNFIRTFHILKEFGRVAMMGTGAIGGQYAQRGCILRVYVPANKLRRASSTPKPRPYSFLFSVYHLVFGDNCFFYFSIFRF